MYHDPVQEHFARAFASLKKLRKIITISSITFYCISEIIHPKRIISKSIENITYCYFPVDLYMDKVFKNGPSKIFGRQALTNLKEYGRLKHYLIHIIQNYLILVRVAQ